MQWLFLLRPDALLRHFKDDGPGWKLAALLILLLPSILCASAFFVHAVAS